MPKAPRQRQRKAPRQRQRKDPEEYDASDKERKEWQEKYAQTHKLARAFAKKHGVTLEDHVTFALKRNSGNTSLIKWLQKHIDKLKNFMAEPKPECCVCLENQPIRSFAELTCGHHVCKACWDNVPVQIEKVKVPGSGMSGSFERCCKKCPICRRGYVWRSPRQR